MKEEEDFELQNLDVNEIKKGIKFKEDDMRIGDKVVFTGCSEEQKKWGGNDDPKGKLVVGEEYIVSAVERHTWHTKISLEGVAGWFNSVCFDRMLTENIFPRTTSKDVYA